MVKANKYASFKSAEHLELKLKINLFIFYTPYMLFLEKDGDALKHF